MIVGVLLVFFVVVAPDGILGLVRKLRDKQNDKRRAAAAAASAGGAAK